MIGSVHYRHADQIVRCRSAKPAPWEEWLDDSEAEVYLQLKDPVRSEQWLAGRLLAKRLIMGQVAANARDIQIHSRDGIGRPTRPRVLLNGQVQSWSLSIAHSTHCAIVGLVRLPWISLGVDVVELRRPPRGFVKTWFTETERQTIGNDGQTALYASAFWAVKEAFYKASNVGQRFTPGHIEVWIDNSGNYGVRVGGAPPSAPYEITVSTLGQEVTAAVTITRSITN